MLKVKILNFKIECFLGTMKFVILLCLMNMKLLYLLDSLFMFMLIV